MKLLKKLFLAPDTGRISLTGAILNTFLVMGLFIAIFWLSLGAINVHLDFSFLGQFRLRILDGFLVTIGISLASLLLSLIIGILSSAGCSSPLLFVLDFCNV